MITPGVWDIGGGIILVYGSIPGYNSGPVLRVISSHRTRPHESQKAQEQILKGFPRRQQPDGESALEELDSLIGLSHVKNLVFEIYAFSEVQKRRAKAGLLGDATILHMIFKGNPGTGKTTVARIIGKILFEAGLLDKGHVVEVERADLVGEYIGHTAQKTREHIRKALGGILFIDEAYSLARGGEKDFGKECIDCIVKGMEDHARDMVFILAGYPVEIERFLKTNPGLRSRFPIHLSFPDYTVGELLQIACLMLKKRDYRFSDDSHIAIENIIRERLAQEVIPSNARMVRNLVEKAIRRQAVRLVRDSFFSRQDLMLVTASDLLEASITP
jgi:stage V sporulation protein K